MNNQITETTRDIQNQTVKENIMSINANNALAKDNTITVKDNTTPVNSNNTPAKDNTITVKDSPMSNCYESEQTNMGNDLSCLIPHCPVMLVLDASHSMFGQGQIDVQNSLKAFFASITYENIPEAQIDVAAVKMGDDLRILAPFAPIAESPLSNMKIRPKGGTPLGRALSLALTALDEQVKFYKAHGMSCVTPQLIVLSDGITREDFSIPAAEIRRRTACGSLICYAVALGKSPDYNALRRFAGDAVKTPMHGDLPRAFGEIGRIVSQVYEGEVEDVINNSMTHSNTPTGCHYLLDGSNIMYWYRCGSVSLDPVLKITEWMAAKGEAYTVFFDASARHILRKFNPAAADKLESLFKTDPLHFLETPAGTQADDFFLMEADQNPGCIILSQDCFNDYKKKYPWVNDKKRIVSGAIVNGVILFPNIGMAIAAPYGNTAKY